MHAWKKLKENIKKKKNWYFKRKCGFLGYFIYFLITLNNKLKKNTVHTCSPLDLACTKLMDLPSEMRTSPGVDIDRKQHENNSNSHHEFMSRQIWSSIYKLI